MIIFFGFVFLILIWLICKQAALISLISEMRKDDFRFLFPKTKLPQWIDSGDLEKVAFTSTPSPTL